MRFSNTYIPTKKEQPRDADIISQRLMLQAGMIKKLASGVYTWLPLGLRVIQHISQVIREEMALIGFSEILMPSIQPAKFWQETDRWDKYGPMLLRITDRHKKQYCFAPTHEEVVTDLIRQDLSSYKSLPIKLFQIQTKFRDEIRPRYGVMRSREFIMKDGYSFNTDSSDLDNTYQQVKDTYYRIFTRLGLKSHAVEADTGDIGGQQSHEFHLMAETGEDYICYSNTGNYAANIELAPVITPSASTDINIPSLSVTKEGQANTVPLKIISGDAGHRRLFFVLKQEHKLNLVKLKKLYTDIQLNLDSALPSDFDLQASNDIIVDQGLQHTYDCSFYDINRQLHYCHINWKHDLQCEFADIRSVVDGDLSPDGGVLSLGKGIEVGHIFQLGNTYTKAMRATFTSQEGNSVSPLMGCYGIGVSRIVGAAIEQKHDENGIIWSDEMSPYQIILLALDYQKDAKYQEAADEVYRWLCSEFSVLFDDRLVKPGAKFADADLLGIPHRIVLTQKLLAKDSVEYKKRASKEVSVLAKKDLLAFLCDNIKQR